MSAIDITEIVDYLDEINSFSNSVDHNFIETLVCRHSFNKSAVLYTLSLFYIFIFIIGLVANSVVVWVNLRAERNRYETHLYILNLAIADLCVVATLPIWVVSLIQHGHWPFGEVMCKITHLIFSVNLFGSIFFLTCMSVDRYISVVLFGDSNSLKKKVVRRFICIFVWLLALAASIPDTYYLKTGTNPISEETSCRPAYPGHSFREWMVGIQLSFIVLGFAIPFPVIAIFYILLARVISSSSDQERRIQPTSKGGSLSVDRCLVPPQCATLQLRKIIFTTQCFSLIHQELQVGLLLSSSPPKTGLAKLIDASKVLIDALSLLNVWKVTLQHG
ncbi:atypical chemokine receptor 3-like [Huso huso]|uniref:Atypical chemokine receptor 3-like n=1 Tax=Huso huso TaxID=61971 RepID=A0ABR0ZKW1_HUSHU